MSKIWRAHSLLLTNGSTVFLDLWDEVMKILKTVTNASITLTTADADPDCINMSDTRTLTIVRGAAASENAPTPLVTYSAPDRKQCRGRPSVGEDQIIRLRRAIVGGDYHIDPRRIAVKLLKRG